MRHPQCCIVVLMVAGLAAPAADARAAQKQTLVVTPANGLADGETVHLHATGFTAGITLAVEECSAKPDAGENDCDISGGQFATANPSGDVDASLQVAVGPFGLNGINCLAAPGCLVSVSELSSNPDELATAQIVFAPRSGPPVGHLPAATTGPASPAGGSPGPLAAIPPLLLALAWAAAVLWRRRQARALAVAAAGSLFLALLPPEIFALVQARSSASGVNAAEAAIVPGLFCQAAVILVLVMEVAMRGRARQSISVVVTSVAVVAALGFVGWPAVTLLGGGPASEGAGPIWYGGAAGCAVAAALAAAATVRALRTRPVERGPVGDDGDAGSAG